MKELKICNTGIGELILRPAKATYQLNSGKVASIHVYDYDDGDSMAINLTKDQVKDLIAALETYVKE